MYPFWTSQLGIRDKKTLDACEVRVLDNRSKVSELNKKQKQVDVKMEEKTQTGWRDILEYVVITIIFLFCITAVSFTFYAMYLHYTELASPDKKKFIDASQKKLVLKMFEEFLDKYLEESEK